MSGKNRYVSTSMEGGNDNTDNDSVEVTEGGSGDDDTKNDDDGAGIEDHSENSDDEIESNDDDDDDDDERDEDEDEDEENSDSDDKSSSNESNDEKENQDEDDDDDDDSDDKSSSNESNEHEQENESDDENESNEDDSEKNDDDYKKTKKSIAERLPVSRTRKPTAKFKDIYTCRVLGIKNKNAAGNDTTGESSPGRGRGRGGGKGRGRGRGRGKLHTVYSDSVTPESQTDNKGISRSELGGRGNRGGRSGRGRGGRGRGKSIISHRPLSPSDFTPIKLKNETFDIDRAPEENVNNVKDVTTTQADVDKDEKGSQNNIDDDGHHSKVIIVDKDPANDIIIDENGSKFRRGHYSLTYDPSLIVLVKHGEAVKRRGRPPARLRSELWNMSPEEKEREMAERKGSLKKRKKRKRKRSDGDEHSDNDMFGSPSSYGMSTSPYGRSSALQNTQYLGYSWDSLMLGKVLGTPALNEYIAHQNSSKLSSKRHDRGFDMKDFVTAHQALQLVRSLRPKTCLPPPGSDLHRIIRKTPFDNRYELNNSDEEVEDSLDENYIKDNELKNLSIQEDAHNTSQDSSKILPKGVSFKENDDRMEETSDENTVIHSKNPASSKTMEDDYSCVVENTNSNIHEHPDVVPKVSTIVDSNPNKTKSFMPETGFEGCTILNQDKTKEAKETNKMTLLAEVASSSKSEFSSCQSSLTTQDIQQDETYESLNDSVGLNMPFKNLARLYQKLCYQDADDGSASKREAHFLTARACIKKLRFLENRATELSKMEDSIMFEGKELGLLPNDYSLAGGFFKPDDRPPNSKY